MPVTRNIKVAFIPAHVNAGVILGGSSVVLGIVSFFPHLLRSWSPPVPLRRQLGVKKEEEANQPNSVVVGIS